MFQTFRLLHIIAFTFSAMSLCLCLEDPYIIYTTKDFEDSAEKIALLHSQELNTLTIYKENVNQNDFITYLNTASFSGNKYLLIIGDETIISPPTAIYGDSDIECNNVHQTEYTDDLFNENFIIGRLLVKNNQEATDQINKIETYILNSNFGAWKNKALLIADDENNPDRPDIEQELKHTTYTDLIYHNRLKNKMIVNTLYGIDYKDNQSMFTDVIINSINSGVGLINYIGHGTINNLAHEDILILDRDINLIETNNRPPIWVVGTCSFGKYSKNNNEISFAEELLKKSDAAIAIIATTEGIKPTDSFRYLDKFYHELSLYLDNSQDVRLGDIFQKAKDADQVHICDRFKYQLFGDPALPIIIAKQVNDAEDVNDVEYNKLFEIPNEITIGKQNSLSINYEGGSYIKIVTDDITYTENINDNDFIEYHSSGGTLFESYFSNQIDYYIPFDITSNSATIIVCSANSNIRASNTYDNIIQFNTVPITISSNSLNEELSDDTNGPEITLHNNDIEITDNISMYAPYNFRIDIIDKFPINMSGHHNHDLLFWINDERNDALILNHMFNPTSDTSGTVLLNFEDSKFEDGTHTFNIESWDILNNNTIKKIRVNINQNLDEIFNIYNFPNPFSEKTFFTFHMNNPEQINVKITIYSKTGKKISTLTDEINDIKSYHVFPESGWNGVDKHNDQLKNGTYFYHLNIKTIDGEILHDKIHKLTILK